MTHSLLLGALLTGLAGSLHCVGMCGGLAVAAGRPAPFLVGRFLGYAAAGAVAGQVGAWLPGPPWVPLALATLLLVLFAAHFAGWIRLPEVVPGPVVRVGVGLLRSGGLLGRVGLGALLAVLPCGLLYAALGLAAASGSAAAGAAAMLAFALGSLPGLLASSVALRRLAQARPWVRQGVAVVALVVGLVALGQRARMVGPARASADAEPNDAPVHACH